jgi:hypothetical protein
LSTLLKKISYGAMATNPQAQGQTTFTFQISEDELEMIKQLAAACRPPIKTGAYIRFLCQEAIEANARVAAEPAPGSEYHATIAAKAHPGPVVYPKVKAPRKPKDNSARK